MDVNSLLKTVTRQRRGCDLNPGPSAPESSTLTTRLPIRYDARFYWNVRSKVDTSLIYSTEPKLKSGKKLSSKNGYAQKYWKTVRESEESDIIYYHCCVSV